MSVSDQIGPGSVDQTYYQGRHLGDNWGDDRKAIFIQQGKENNASDHLKIKTCSNDLITSMIVALLAGSFDISSLPETKGPAPKTGEMPAYVNTQQIDAQVLAALQAEAENVSKGKESPQKDLFDMSKNFFCSSSCFFLSSGTNGVMGCTITPETQQDLILTLISRWSFNGGC